MSIMKTGVSKMLLVAILNSGVFAFGAICAVETCESSIGGLWRRAVAVM